MESLMITLFWLGVFVAGVGIRFAVLPVVLLLLSAPVVIALLSMQGVEHLRNRGHGMPRAPLRAVET